MLAFKRSTVWSGVVFLSASSLVGAVGFENHRIVARGAIQLLPEPIAPLFAYQQLGFVERALEPVSVWPRDPDMRKRQTWQWVPLDLGAREQTREARMEAAARFPRSAAGVKKLYKAHHLRVGGALPWAVEQLYEECVEAFQQGREEDVIRSAGHLAHFAGVCASPFAATTDQDGRLSGSLHLGAQEPGDDHYAHQNVRYRFDMALANRNGSRYAEKLALEEAAYEPVAQPVDAAFTILLDSLGCVDEVLAADSEIIRRLEVTDGGGFAKRADEFYVLFDERCGDLSVERLRAGAVFAAGLIGGAWEAAGKPTIEQIRARANAAPPATAALDDDGQTAGRQADAGFVGSNNSKVFHHPECPHAQRISSANRVRFRTSREALDQGRRPCKTCNPGDEH
ncbi:MAG: hypothetical protein JSV19_09550 [Phycisphaerales bacterium]|nr:MAG: hypothetical protein JSV19_09550 [Phycisphaerales bacterium]